MATRGAFGPRYANNQRIADSSRLNAYCSVSLTFGNYLSIASDLEWSMTDKTNN
ncbi:hypothetical protein [Moorena producens]|uniref:hypothetical protein n=1 Tax=Moorena producens TaxID=1155739 RepID=UPI001314B08D|nr:hypothetical protein [Moorena producens]